MTTQNTISIKVTPAGSDENLRFATISLPCKLGADFRIWAL